MRRVPHNALKASELNTRLLSGLRAGSADVGHLTSSPIPQVWLKAGGGNYELLNLWISGTSL
jgi:hypothetical protein